jgi:hypothetical protein
MRAFNFLIAVAMLAMSVISAMPTKAEQNYSVGRPADGFTQGGTYASFHDYYGQVYTRPMPRPPVTTAVQVGHYGDTRVIVPSVHTVWNLNTRERSYLKFDGKTPLDQARRTPEQVSAAIQAAKAKPGSYIVATTKNEAGTLQVTITNKETHKVTKFRRSDLETWRRSNYGGTPYTGGAYDGGDLGGANGNNSDTGGGGAAGFN